jgi:hypothetical protein
MECSLALVIEGGRNLQIKYNIFSRNAQPKEMKEILKKKTVDGNQNKKMQKNRKVSCAI